MSRRQKKDVVEKRYDVLNKEFDDIDGNGSGWLSKDELLANWKERDHEDYDQFEQIFH